MRHQLSLISACFFLCCGPASAKDFYVTAFEDDYEAVYAVASASIVDQGGGVKRVDLIRVDLEMMVMEDGGSDLVGFLGVRVYEVNCQSAPRQAKLVSSYLQQVRTESRTDTTPKSAAWTAIPPGSKLAFDADFVCRWPAVKPDPDVARIEAADAWVFVDKVVAIVRNIQDEK